MIPLNLLLILSSEQKPEPEKEVISLRGIHEDIGSVYFATTRYVQDLTRGKSEVALYGDEKLNYRLLARSRFLGFVPQEDPKADEILRSGSLYSESERPDTFRGFLHLGDFRLTNQEEEPLDSLDGILFMAKHSR